RYMRIRSTPACASWFLRGMHRTLARLEVLPAKRYNAMIQRRRRHSTGGIEGHGLVYPDRAGLEDSVRDRVESQRPAGLGAAIQRRHETVQAGVRRGGFPTPRL